MWPISANPAAEDGVLSRFIFIILCRGGETVSLEDEAELALLVDITKSKDEVEPFFIFMTVCRDTDSRFSANVEVRVALLRQRFTVHYRITV